MANSCVYRRRTFPLTKKGKPPCFSKTLSHHSCTVHVCANSLCMKTSFISSLQLSVSFKTFLLNLLIYFTQQARRYVLVDNTMSLRIRWCPEMSCRSQRAARHMWTFATAILVQTWNMSWITSLSTWESSFYQVHWALTTRRNILPSCITFSIYRLAVWFLSWIFFKKKKKETKRNKQAEFYRQGFRVEKPEAIILAVKMSPPNWQLPNLSS